MSTRKLVGDPRRAGVVGLLLAALALTLALAGCGRSGCDDVYARSTSPDGRYEVVVCRHSGGFAMPGQGGDAPGLVRLREVSTGRVLNEAPIDMVQLFPGVVWEGGHARIKLIADWSLPSSSADR